MSVRRGISTAQAELSFRESCRRRCVSVAAIDRCLEMCYTEAKENCDRTDPVAKQGEEA